MQVKTRDTQEQTHVTSKFSDQGQNTEMVEKIRIIRQKFKHNLSNPKIIPFSNYYSKSVNTTILKQSKREVW